ncbi:universal stress protein [Hydrogenibacillus sp. N12]|uniref:universal stress protein n=1 Tax=Hydrogenibacillus sp. N12 TaxID=2866627 RepID=UPI001C7D95CA|nr:universal stress protein [Hydrogenibacillus sp. N12]QZA32420.1 universal stress protein [Hydrogenibacillus sp. N12]
MFEKILLPYDGSSHAKKAVELVKKLCAGSESRCRVTVMYVLEPYTPPPEAAALDVDWAGVAERSGQAIVADAVQALREQGIAADPFVAVGHPAEEIVGEAKRGGYELIVIGRRGLGLFGEIVLGSVSHKVLHLAPCPVLIAQ